MLTSLIIKHKLAAIITTVILDLQITVLTRDNNKDSHFLEALRLRSLLNSNNIYIYSSIILFVYSVNELEDVVIFLNKDTVIEDFKDPSNP